MRNHSYHISQDKRGLAPIVIILITAVVSLGVAGGGVWYWQDQQAKKQKEDSDKKVAELQKQVDDSKKQIEDSEKELEELKKSTSNTSSSSGSSSSNSNTFKVKELGIQFTLPSSISDAYYVMNGSDDANFTTKSLVSLGGKDCEAGSSAPSVDPIGSISLKSGEFIKKIGNKSLYFVGPQDVCSENKGAEAKQTQGITALKEALKSATAIQ